MKRSREDDEEPLQFTREHGHFVGKCQTPVVLSRHGALANPGIVDCLRRALTEHGVLIFPDQSSIEPEDEVALARCFDHDPTEEHPPKEPAQATNDSDGAAAACLGGEPWLASAPEVRLVCNTSDWPASQRLWQQTGVADTKPAPPRVCTQRAVRTPCTGGDTLFACTRRIAERLLADEAARRADGRAPLDPPPSTARATYRRHQHNEVPEDGVAITRASGPSAESHGPYPLIAADGRGPLVVYDWSLEAIVRPDDSKLSPPASWAYARQLLEPDLGLGSPSMYRHRWRDGESSCLRGCLPQPSTASHGLPRRSAAFHGLPRPFCGPSVPFRALPWPSMAFCGLPWPSVALRCLPLSFRGLPLTVHGRPRPSGACH